MMAKQQRPILAQKHNHEAIVNLLKRFEQRGIAALNENAYAIMGAAKKLFEQKEYEKAYVELYKGLRECLLIRNLPCMQAIILVGGSMRG